MAKRLEASPSGIGTTWGVKPPVFKERTSFDPQRWRTGGTVTTKMRLAWGSNSPSTEPARVSRPFSIQAWYGRGSTWMVT